MDQANEKHIIAITKARGNCTDAAANDPQQ